MVAILNMMIDAASRGLVPLDERLRFYVRALSFPFHLTTGSLALRPLLVSRHEQSSVTLPSSSKLDLMMLRKANTTISRTFFPLFHER